MDIPNFNAEVTCAGGYYLRFETISGESSDWLPVADTEGEYFPFGGVLALKHINIAQITTTEKRVKVEFGVCAGSDHFVFMVDEVEKYFLQTR